MTIGPWIIAIVIAYLCGTVPFGLLIGFGRGVDIRQHGSCNIGATNCGRVCGRKWGLLCFVLDMLKGAAPVLAAGWWFGLIAADAAPSAQQAGLWTAVAAAAVLGHVFPIWLRFRGGKGVATGFGAIVGLWPYLTLPAVGALLTWLLFTGVFRYSSLASVVAALLLPLYLIVAAALLDWPADSAWPFGLIAGLMALLIVVRHRANLARLWAGSESRVR